MLETTLRDNDDRERCGFVLDDGSVVELPNVAADPANSYEIDPESAVEYLRGGRVRGTWHTHPDTDPNLSGADHDGFAGWPELDHYIIGRRQGTVVVRHYRFEDGLLVACA